MTSMPRYLCFLFLLLSEKNFFSAAASASSNITEEELVINACAIDQNRTIYEKFRDDVIDRYNLTLEPNKISNYYCSSPRMYTCYFFPLSLFLSFSLSLDLNFVPNAYVGVQRDIPCYSCRIFPWSTESYIGEVVWCVSIWHPTELIDACFNRTWNYSTPLAKDLGILNNLEIIDSCRFLFYKYQECVRMRSVELYYEKAIFFSIRGDQHYISTIDVKCKFVISKHLLFYCIVQINQPLQSIKVIISHHLQCMFQQALTSCWTVFFHLLLIMISTLAGHYLIIGIFF